MIIETCNGRNYRFCLENRQGKPITTTNYCGINAKNHNISFDQKSLNYLLDQDFSSAGSLIFCQTISILVGSDPTTFRTNVFFI